MARSSKLRRPVRRFRLLLTRGGDAQLIDVDDGQDVVWESVADEDFRAEFEGFLGADDVFDILDYLEEIGELTRHEADRCDVEEEYYEPEDLAGMFR